MSTASVKKTVMLTRAVPGSGKTTIANCIAATLHAAGLRSAIHSTDSYFLNADGRYCFDPTRLSEYHARNLAAFSESVAAGIDLVVCDNTNLSSWEAEPYTNVARRHACQVIVLNFVPRQLEQHVAAQQVTAEKPDAHGVPVMALIEMIRRYHAYNRLLDKTTPLDPCHDVKYIWDYASETTIRTSEPLRHYDCDVVLEIQPDAYQAAKTRLGPRILDLINGARHNPENTGLGESISADNLAINI